ncbi:microfibrillar-associated protein 1-like [Crassostrea angulata]|uniref:microfibrillar-associated protein 1-like n=1 Tax=Magallana angulata TaxID=2784310 RepID=UPI0022B113CE|nr:microfibrillar-associated protein 1-like [Crassostrea angulata]
MKTTFLCLAISCGILLVQARSHIRTNDDEKAMDRLVHLLESAKDLEVRSSGEAPEERKLKEEGKRPTPPPRDSDDEGRRRRPPPSRDGDKKDAERRDVLMRFLEKAEDLQVRSSGEAPEERHLKEEGKRPTPPPRDSDDEGRRRRPPPSRDGDKKDAERRDLLMRFLEKAEDLQVRSSGEAPEERNLKEEGKRPTPPPRDSDDEGRRRRPPPSRDERRRWF